MSDPALPITVRIRFQPYNHGDVQILLRRMQQDFGLPGHTRRWWFRSPDAIVDSVGSADVWSLDFHFREANDAMIFALKYQR